LIIRRVAVSIFLSICSIGLRADTVTLPAAASVQGLALFISDVRVFNTSYMASVAVTATYRFGSQPVKAFNLAPRESKSFDDICVSLFATPNSLGAVEFTSSAPAGTIVVTSRLYSPFPTGGAVGMFIPGLPSSAAQPATVLPGLMNGASRTNVGVYNPNDASVNVAVRLYDGPVLLGTVPLTLGPRTGTQISNIYKSLGYDTLVRTDGVCTVDSGGASPLFSYAAMADNATQDTILVVGAPDVAAPAGYNPPSPTPTGGSGGPTPTPTPTPTPSAASTHIVNVGKLGHYFADAETGASTSTIRVGDTIQWVWFDGPHSTTSGTCTSGGYVSGTCTPDGRWDSSLMSPTFTFSQKFNTAGTFNYFCLNHLGDMTGVIRVQP
jgi:plastocyanin